VDLAAVYRDREVAFARELAAEGVGEAERQRALVGAQTFARAIPTALDELAEECRCVVLLGNAVAGHGGRVADLTPTLRRKVGM
jgi:hypothetical protein